MKRSRIFLLVTVCVVGAIGLYYLLHLKHMRDTYVELPELEEIVEIRVRVVFGTIEYSISGESEAGNSPRKVDFIVLNAHWQPILDSFRPYERGEHGQKGGMIGDITLKLKDGKIFRIGLLIFFSEGEDRIQIYLGPDGVVHLGGDKRKLDKALKAALKASKK